MRAITDLEAMGYTFTLNGDHITYTHEGNRPDSEIVRPLLDYLRRHRDEAIHFMQLLSRLETTFQLVKVGGPKENDTGAMVTFLALLAAYEAEYA
jgi:hypothetical protein